MPSLIMAPMGCAEAMLMGMRLKLQPPRCNHDPWLSPMLVFRVVWISAQEHACPPLCGPMPGLSEQLSSCDSTRSCFAAKFINNVRILCKKGSERVFLDAKEDWVNTDGTTQACRSKTGEPQSCFVGLGRARRR